MSINKGEKRTAQCVSIRWVQNMNAREKAIIRSSSYHDPIEIICNNVVPYRPPNSH